MWWDGPWNWFPWMWVFPLFFLVVLALFVFRGPRWLMCSHGDHGRPQSAREILDSRYSRGEISREEYQRMRKDME